MVPQKTMAARAAVFCVAIALTPIGRSQGLERFKNGVVEVVVGQSAGMSEIGTGLVISADGGTLSVLTARHLFYKGRELYANDTSVTLYLDKLNPRKGTLVTDSPNLDLAVIEILVASSSVAQQMPTFSVRPDSAPLSIGDTLYVFGGKSQGWQVPPVTISGLKDGDRPDRFRFTGIGIRPAFSGAALLDNSGRLAAVHLGTVDEDFGHAQRMAYALGILKDLGVKMNKLSFGGTPAPIPSPTLNETRPAVSSPLENKETMTQVVGEMIISKTVQWETTTYYISRPEVRSAMTPITQIQFKPGDQVTINAGGCVQTGGAGRTWKRYVDPRGANVDRLYHGLISLPGMPQLVRISDVIGRSLTIPPLDEESHTYLRIGYEDEVYSDNGYYSRDDGSEDQCKGVGNAFIEVKVTQSAPR